MKASENKRTISLSLEDKKTEKTGKMEVRNSVPMPEKYKKEFGMIHIGFRKAGMKCVITLRTIPIQKLQTGLLHG